MQGASIDDAGDDDKVQNQSDVDAAVSDDESGASQSTESSLQESDVQEPEEEEEQQHQEQRLAQPLSNAPAPKQQQQQLESKFMELPPVLEIDEEVRYIVDTNTQFVSESVSHYDINTSANM